MSQAQEKINGNIEEEIPGVSQELIVWEKLNPAEIFKAGGLDSVLKEIDEKARSVILGGVETQKDRDNIRAVASKVSRAKTFVQKIGTKNTEEYRALTKESNRERDRGVSFLQDLQEDIRKPLTEWEAERDRKKTEIEKVIDSLSAYANFEEETEADSECIKSRLGNLQCTYSNFSFPEEYKDRANYIYERAKIALTEKLENRIKYESDQKELAELREKQAAQTKKDEEDRIRQEAADKATKDTEEKARIERESAEKAAADRLAAEEAKTARIEREKKDTEAKLKKAEADQKAAVQAEKDRAIAEKQREKEAAEKREANKKHRAKINNEALYCLKDIGLDEDMAKSVTEAIANGYIPNIKIIY